MSFAERDGMTRRCRGAAAALLILPGLAAAVGLAARSGAIIGPEVLTFLRQDLGLSTSDLRDVHDRRAVSRTLPTTDNREVATAGAVQIGVPASFYIEQLRDIVNFKRSPAVLQIGTFGTPARVEDVADLTLPRGDIDGLRRCRVHDCNIQLSDDAIVRFQREVNWTAPDAADQANRLMRQLLVELVNGYRDRGAEALMAYQDRRRPLSTGEEFAALAADGVAVLRRHPEFLRHVLHYPHAPAPGTTDLIYWSKEKVGPAEVVSVTHMAFGRPGRPPVRFAVASKQIYGSRYFDASLGLTLLLHDDHMDDDQALLVYVNRSRVHVLRGFLGGLKRTVVRSRTRSTMADYLEQARDMVERRFAGHRSRPARDTGATAASPTCQVSPHHPSGGQLPAGPVRPASVRAGEHVGLAARVCAPMNDSRATAGSRAPGEFQSRAESTAVRR